jgi:hypothetical protein
MNETKKLPAQKAGGRYKSKGCGLCFFAERPGVAGRGVRQKIPVSVLHCLPTSAILPFSQGDLAALGNGTSRKNRCSLRR